MKANIVRYRRKQLSKTQSPTVKTTIKGSFKNHELVVTDFVPTTIWSRRRNVRNKCIWAHEYSYFERPGTDDSGIHFLVVNDKTNRRFYPTEEARRAEALESILLVVRIRENARKFQRNQEPNLNTKFYFKIEPYATE